MESDRRYYWRRACEELYAASRAITPAARNRRRELAETYIAKLRALPGGRVEAMAMPQLAHAGTVDELRALTAALAPVAAEAS